MRRKIAKRYRKKILQSGAEIVDEHWEKDGGNCKDRCYVFEVNYCGWNIHAPEKDELAAYKAALECFPDCEADSNYIRIVDERRGVPFDEAWEALKNESEESRAFFEKAEELANDDRR